MARCKISSPNYSFTNYISSNARALGNVEHSFLSSFLGPLWPRVVAPDRVLSMSQIELICVLMLNWIAWHRIVLICKLRTYAKLNCLKWNCFCMLNWIVWNRTVFYIETVLTLNWIVWNKTVLTFNCVGIKTILRLIWIVWIRTVWFNWILWNRNVFQNGIVYLLCYTNISILALS